MAASPVKPSQFRAVIPASGDKLCRKLVLSLIKFPTLFYQWFSWAFNEDGTPSDNWKTSIGVTVGALAAPTNVQASDGTFTDKVTLSWDPVGGATHYEVFRSGENVASTAVSIGSTGTGEITFSDNNPADNTNYWYFVRSKNATDSSGFSAGDKGFTDTTGSGGSGSTVPRKFNGSGTFVVQAGTSLLQVEAWGGGGGGGGSGCPGCKFGESFYGGGGGGSGEYLKVTGIPVVPLETLHIIFEPAGVGGGDGYATGGTAGGNVYLRRGDVDLVRAHGGAGGGPGRTGSSNGRGGEGGGGGGYAPPAVLADSASGATGNPGTFAANPPPYGAGGPAVGGAPTGTNAGGNGGSFSEGAPGTKGYMILTPS